ncbi:hypothetical protein NGM44_05950 [Moraxella sp. FZFQ2102]|uniref:S6 family peptidase n=1 Tax=Moraxella sp. FZFQ2102 TaxID=2953752 RepID=UPI00209C1B4C|nr:S6 family peptidase [Moraxella sp. FZFQ2102]USZ13948.1 hypothetical protein NGM44_05950 [Moraxella sp. FZFQ2102]
MSTNTFRLSILSAAICTVFAHTAYASIVPNDIPYQDFRDFAENKGRFTVGATNIPIYNTNNVYLGTAIKNAPMPDFSAMATDGRATLVSAQYVAGVAHNTHTSMSFGHHGAVPNFSYKIVARNNLAEPMTNTTDYHAPRLHKLVTEVAPIPIHYAGEQQTAYEDANRFSAYARAGSGRQYIGTGAEDDQKTAMAWAYKYLTGGGVPNFSRNKGNGTIVFERNISTDNGVLPTIIEPGDSGSPLLAYDRNTGRWGIIGVTRAYSSNEFWYVTMKPEFHTQKLNKSHTGTLTNNQAGSQLRWTKQGDTSSLVGNGKSISVPLKANTGNEINDLDHGKSVRIDGQDSTVTLGESLDQGAGALEIGANVTLKGSNPNTTWTGAGVVVDAGKVATWQLKNPDNDRLSKLGQGTLFVNGIGVNQGDISVGDGRVVLAMQPDATGNKQAFENLEIVSGRGTVVLNDNGQIKPENIRFGYRGGRLDLNGTQLDTQHLFALDDGAKIVNHDSGRIADITWRGQGKVDHRIFATGTRQTQADKLGSTLTWGRWGTAGADIYEYVNPYANNRKDYFMLNDGGNAGSYFPTSQSSNSSWTFIGTDKTAAIETAFTQKQADRLVWGKWGVAGADIYEYINTHAGNRKDYFILKDGGNARRYFPTQQTDNDSWIYLGSDKFTAIKNALRYYDAKNLTWGDWGKAGADIYEYINTHAGNRKDYFVLKDGGNAGKYFPTNQTSNADWEYLGSDKSQAENTVLARLQAVGLTTLFAGHLGEDNGVNGAMNFTFKPTNAQDHLALTGGMKLVGEFKVNDGTVLLTGKPVPYAYDHLGKQEVIKDNEWINRDYRANVFSVNHDGKLIFGRNVALATGSFNAAQQGLLQFGFVQGMTPSCIQSEHTGKVGCSTPTLSQVVYGSMPTLQAQGNIRAQHNAKIHIGKATLTGAITADNGTHTTIEQDGKWLMTGNSSIGSLQMNGGEVDLNAANNHGRYQSLTINGNLSGQGKFHYLTNAAARTGDHVTVNGTAQGTFNLVMNNTGAEPNEVSPISLLRVKGANQDPSKLNLSLNGGYVDLGAYRYILANDRNDYRLYSPLRDVQIARNYEQIQTLLNEAQQSAQEYQAEVDRLTSMTITTLAEQQGVQNSLLAAEQKVAEQQAYIDSLYWYQFLTRIQARNQLTELQRQLAGYSQLQSQLQTTIEALNRSLEHAQDQLGNAQAQTEVVDLMVADIYKQADAICRQTQSAEICEAVVHKASDELVLDIAQKDGISRYSNAALSEVSAQVADLMQIDRAMHTELTDAKHEPVSVWVKYDNQQSRSGSSWYRDYAKDSALVQFGAEGAVADGVRAGVVLSDVQSDLIAEQAQGENRLKTATAYAKLQTPAGWVASVQAGIGQVDNQLVIDEKTADIERTVRSVGATLAKSWQVGGARIQPSVGIKHHQLTGSAYQLSGAQVQIRPLDITSYQAGVKLSYPLQIGALTVTPSVTTLLQDASDNAVKHGDISINGKVMAQNFDRVVSHELGVDAAAKNFSLGASVGVIDGEQSGKERYAGVKVGYRW